MLQAIALERAQIVGIAQLRPQVFEELPIAQRPLGADISMQVQLQIRGDVIVVEQRVIDVEEKDCIGHWSLYRQLYSASLAGVFAARSVSKLVPMETFLKDVRQSLRMFFRSPGFTVTAVAALAIGIGANTAIFSVINTVLLRPLPYPDADRMVVLTITSPQGSFPGASVTKYNIWRERTDVFEEISAVAKTTVNLTGVDNPEQLQAARVTASMFPLFGLAIAHGRGFTGEEDRPGGPNVAVLSDELWTRRFGRDPSVVGKTISLSGDAYQIVGISAPENNMEANPPIELYLPVQIGPARIRRTTSLASRGSDVASHPRWPLRVRSFLPTSFGRNIALASLSRRATVSVCVQCTISWSAASGIYCSCLPPPSASCS